MDPSYQQQGSNSQPQPVQPATTPSPQVAFMAPPPPSRPKGLIVGVIVVGFLAVVFGGLAIWAFLAYSEQKSDVDARIEQASSKAVKEQKEADALQLAQELKKPYWKFNGPADYGGLSFNYPRTWDVYVAEDGRDGKTFEAYLDKGTVPPVDDTQQFALRVTITDNDYDKVVDEYDDLIKKGDVKSTPVKANGQDGLRFDGKFTKDIQGSAVIYKIRDKTLIVQTDISTGEIKDDFEALIKTIMFNT